MIYIYMKFSTDKVIFLSLLYDLVKNSHKIQVVKRILCPQRKSMKLRLPSRYNPYS